MNLKEMEDDLTKIKEVIEQTDHKDKQKLLTTLDAQLKVLKLLKQQQML